MVLPDAPDTHSVPKTKVERVEKAKRYILIGYYKSNILTKWHGYRILGNFSHHTIAKIATRDDKSSVTELDTSESNFLSSPFRRILREHAQVIAREYGYGSNRSNYVSQSRSNMASRQLHISADRIQKEVVFSSEFFLNSRIIYEKLNFVYPIFVFRNILKKEFAFISSIPSLFSKNFEKKVHFYGMTLIHKGFKKVNLFWVHNDHLCYLGNAIANLQRENIARQSEYHRALRQYYYHIYTSVLHKKTQMFNHTLDTFRTNALDKLFHGSMYEMTRYTLKWQSP